MSFSLVPLGRGKLLFAPLGAVVNHDRVDGRDGFGLALRGRDGPRLLLRSRAAREELRHASAGNLPSRNAPHMDSLTMTVAGDKMTQAWSFYADGKVTQTVNFNFKKQG